MKTAFIRLIAPLHCIAFRRNLSKVVVGVMEHRTGVPQVVRGACTALYSSTSQGSPRTNTAQVWAPQLYGMQVLGTRQSRLGS